MGKEITFKNGHEAVINIASFSKAMKLKNAIAKALLKENIDISKLDFENLNSLFSGLLAVDSDEDVNKAIFDCLAKSLYNKEKITIDTFEDEKARENYYLILIECLKLNLSPFIKPLISKFQDIKPTTSISQKLK